VVTGRTRARWWGLAFVAIAGIAVFLWWLLQPELEERRIRRRLDAFAGVVERRSGSSALRVAVASERLPGFFCNPVDVDIPEVGLTGRFTPEEISSHISRTLLSVKHLQLTFPDVHLDSVAGAGARIRVTARLQAALRTGEDVDEVRELVCELRKVEGRWRFRDVKRQPVLER